MVDMTKESFHINSPVGLIDVEVESGKLTGISYIKSKSANNRSATRLTPAAKKIQQQIKAYFQNGRKKPLVPVKFQRGTDFQQKVWRELMKIKPGKTLSYGSLAEKVNSGPRAVANACRQNPIPIIVPCHRVVSSSGIGGYHGQTRGKFIDIKKTLLAHEGWNGAA